MGPERRSATLTLDPAQVDTEHRTVTGVCVPYRSISKLTPHPKGERILPHAFDLSLQGRQVFLNLDHNEEKTIGRSIRFDTNNRDGLVGTFEIRRSPLGDEVLEDLLDGWWPGMSVGFRVESGRFDDHGVFEVRSGFLGHVALCRVPAYDGAKVLAATRQATDPGLDGRDVIGWARVMKATGPKPDLPPLPWRVRRERALRAIAAARFF